MAVRPAAWRSLRHARSLALRATFWIGLYLLVVALERLVMPWAAARAEAP